MITGLLHRIMGERADSFITETIPVCQGKDTFEIDNFEGKIILRGNNNISLAMALRQYIQEYLHGDISWWGIRMDDELPMPQYEKVTVSQQVRSYMNYCTFSYSCAWWDWERWQYEIDLMAMYGINMPLAIVGVEYVWFNTLKRYSYTDSEALCYLSSPAHIAWQFMNNLEGHNPYTDVEELKARYALGKKIVDRMREYGMNPIMQGFSGTVPRNITEKLGVNVKLGDEWCSFKGTAILDPLDPFFKEFGTAFLEERTKLFGESHLYAADPFHESKPIENTKSYLNKVGKTIIDMITAHDSKAIWIMQGWTPYEHIIKAVPKDRLLILDLDGKHYKSRKYFWGYNFILGNLHNFGGRINLHGDIRYIASNPYIKLRKHRQNVVGTGLFMEGIEQNPMYYSLAFEMLTKSSNVNIKKWCDEYSRRRYGIDDDNLTKALHLLTDSVYKRGTNSVESSSMVCARPALNPKKSGPNDGFIMKYKPQLVENAAKYMSNCAEQLKDIYQFTYDYADITRQAMSNKLQILIKKTMSAYGKRDRETFSALSADCLALLSDMDKMLYPIPHLSLTKWINSARKCAITSSEAERFDYAARELVTIWGSEGQDPSIFDYAWREWGGLIGEFYLPRWQSFFDMLDNTFDNGIKYSEKNLPNVYGRESFRANQYYNSLANKEIAFLHKNCGYATVDFRQAINITTKNILKYIY